MTKRISDKDVEEAIKNTEKILRHYNPSIELVYDASASGYNMNEKVPTGGQRNIMYGETKRSLYDQICAFQLAFYEVKRIGNTNIHIFDLDE